MIIPPLFTIKAALLKFSVYALICVGIWLSGYALGGHHCRNANEAKQAKAQDEAIAKASEQAQKDLNIAVAVEQAQEKTKTEFRTITKEVIREVEKPIYRDCVLPADGLRLWNAANAGALKADSTSKPDDNLP